MELPEKMKAVVCKGPEDYRVKEVDTPSPGREEIIIKIKAAGICASDLKAYKGAKRFWGGKTPFLQAPVIPGHEFFGEVVALGEDAGKKFDVEIGDLVTPEPIIPCNDCYFCDRGKYWMCDVHNLYGFKKGKAEGGMAEFAKIVSNSRVHKIPSDLSLSEAALIEPFANGLHAVNQGDIGFEDDVVLAGAGSIGLGMVQFIKLRTPKSLTVVDLDDDRLELAGELGADICLNPKRDDVVREIKKNTGGYGCDVFIESTGAVEGIKMGLKALRRMGRFVEFSVFGEKADIDWSVVSVQKELEIKGAHLTPYTYPVVIDLFSRELITAEGIVTDTFAIEEFEEAVSKARGSMEAIKVILKP